MVHEIKCVQPFFNAVLDGSKLFELRYNDRDYAVGDILRIDEYIPNVGYTSRYIFKRIGFIVSSFNGLENGYVIMSLLPQK